MAITVVSFGRNSFAVQMGARNREDSHAGVVIKDHLTVGTHNNGSIRQYD